MRVALFIPCYVDWLAPQVGLATLSLLERHGVEVEFPSAQTCTQGQFNRAVDRPVQRLVMRRAYVS